jgi:hypothetical protein
MRDRCFEFDSYGPQEAEAFSSGLVVSIGKPGLMSISILMIGSLKLAS